MAQEAKKKRSRSPSYPGINLKTAIERARTFYDQETRHAAPVVTAVGHWGYKPKSGPGLVTLAALKKFGLFNDEGSAARRKVKLSPLALRILLDSREGSADRAEALREAALKPSIHEELWQTCKGGQLPSDANLRTYLLIERGFTERGADEFIGEFRETMEFAGLVGSDILADTGGENGLDEGVSMSAASEPLPGSHENMNKVRDFTFTITLYGGRLATLKAPVPMSKRNLERLQRMIGDQLEPLLDEDEPEA